LAGSRTAIDRDRRTLDVARALGAGLDVTAWDPAPGAEAQLRANVANAWPALERAGLAKGASQERLRVVSTVDQHANTSAASIPLALDVAVRDGRVRAGHNLLLLGVGGGFTWGSVLLRW